MLKRDTAGNAMPLFRLGTSLSTQEVRQKWRHDSWLTSFKEGWSVPNAIMRQRIAGADHHPYRRAPSALLTSFGKMVRGDD